MEARHRRTNKNLANFSILSLLYGGIGRLDTPKGFLDNILGKRAAISY